MERSAEKKEKKGDGKIKTLLEPNVSKAISGKKER